MTYLICSCAQAVRSRRLSLSQASRRGPLVSDSVRRFSLLRSLLLPRCTPPPLPAARARRRTPSEMYMPSAVSSNHGSCVGAVVINIIFSEPVSLQSLFRLLDERFLDGQFDPRETERPPEYDTASMHSML